MPKRGGDGTSMRPPVSGPLFNIDQFSNKTNVTLLHFELDATSLASVRASRPGNLAFRCSRWIWRSAGATGKRRTLRLRRLALRGVQEIRVGFPSADQICFIT
jgi:hypothetical protein